MIAHIIPRLLPAALGFAILGYHTIEINKGGGNSGMDIKIWLFISLGILFLEGVYLLLEMLYLISKSKYKLAWCDCGLLFIGFAVFLVLMRWQ